MDEVYMDVPAVKDMGKSFQTISEVLERVSQTLQVLITILKTTAFVGLVGGTAVAHFMEIIKPHVDRVSAQCAELGRDLNFSAEAYQRGDALGATRFY